MAVIAYHSSDQFANSYSSARISYYGITGFPTAEFDGVIEVVGGSSSSSLYSTYVPHVNTRNAVLCDYTVDIYGQNTSGLTYDIVLDLNQVNGSPVSNLVAHLVITESGFPVSWGICSEANYVCRSMVPDENGTSIDFTGSSNIQLSLQFTLDPSWDVNELELVSFIQDNTSKEVMQGSKVALTELQPLQATAAFTASDTVTCETYSVQFFDNSLGNVTSWDWTFEGGDPATSTLQNPTVTYNNHGEYNVELIVDDGSVTDTLLNEDFMLVKSIPAQPNTPVGPTGTCEGGEFEYTTDPVTYASSYTWDVDPSDAGYMTGTGTTGTFHAAVGWTGSYDVTVRAENECGDGVYSGALTGDLYHRPIAYQISQGGGYCEGEPGVEFKVYGSEAGVDYEIYIDDEPTGIIEAGTGDTISFGYQSDEGIYTVLGFTDHCTNFMIGQSWIHMVDPPGQAAMPAGPEQACNNDQSDFSTSGAANADTYNWYLNPPEAGVLNPNGLDAEVVWDVSYTGAAFISVEGENDCGTGPVSDEFEVSVFAAPTPEVSGLALVCNDEEADYSTVENSGSTYEWSVTGGTIISGAGTFQVTVKWGDPGTGYVSVIEENAEGCMESSEEFEVTIDDCTGVEELADGAIRIYPNPAANVLNVEINLITGTSFRLHLLNQLGQAVYEAEQPVASGQQVIRIDVDDFPEGIYIIQLSTEDGGVVQDKFVKIK